jgi:hypothetical protein
MFEKNLAFLLHTRIGKDSLWKLKLTSKNKVCAQVSTKIKHSGNWKTHIFVDEVKTQSREKPLRGSQTQEFHYSKDEARYKIVTLTCTDAVVVPCPLTCNSIRMLPNQVSYLKGSSMESFTLGPTPKIDFRCSAAHLWRLQRDLELLWALVEFNTEFLQFSMPRSLYL